MPERYNDIIKLSKKYENTTRRVSMRILVIEDERALCETIVRSLKRLAYSVDFCYDGNKANELLGIEKYDLVLLDLNLPGADGMTVLRTLRQTDRDTGVLILSARCEVADKVEGLDAGANDYLTKPFHLEELEARIRSLTRRRFTQNNVVLNCGKVAFDTKARVAVADGQELSLTRKEIGILEYLLLNHGKITIYSYSKSVDMDVYNKIKFDE
jgi:two-component system OmpR family response regulator